MGKTGLTAETCTAMRIDPPVHGYFQNTVPSMRATRELGADVVELDIHPTADGNFAVFPDWTQVFQRRLEQYGTRIYAVGPYHGGEFSTGINTPQELETLPNGYVGGIWTDRIDLISPLLRVQQGSEAANDH